MKAKILLSLLLSLALSLGIQHQAQATKHVITQSGFTFNPSNLTNVNVGDTIRWVWTSGVHTTTSTTIPAGATSWNAPLTSSNPSFEYPVQVSGVYDYICIYHASIGMTGSFTVNSPPALTITGNVFDDANGLLGVPLNTVDGTPTNAGGSIHANLVNASNTVLATVPVGALGTYGFGSANGVQANTSFKVILTTTAGVVGATLTTATLPANWVSTGENIGNGAGNDGSANSILTVPVASTSVSNANFGIEQLPTPVATGPAPQFNPGGINNVTLQATAFSGTDPESPAGVISELHITAFPTNITSISINGTLYESASWPVAGVVIPTNSSGNPTQPISIDPLNGSVTVGITFTVLDNAGKESTSNATLEVVFNDPLNTISGILSYNDNGSVGLPNSTINLRNLADNSLVQSTSTNNSGGFSFTGVPDGNYALQATTSVLWGGVNATDALAILKHFVGISYLSGLRLIAANVDNNTFVNSLDALVAARRFVGLITTFPVGDWYFQSPSVSVSGSNTYTVDFQGICYGDADGSYSSFLLKSASPVAIEHTSNQIIRPGQEVTVPVTLAQQTISVGAVSLALSLPEGISNIENVIIPGDQGSLLYYQQDNLLKISWFSLQPQLVEANSPLLFITFNASELLPEGTSLDITQAGYCEVANAEAKVIQDVTLDIPTLVSSPASSVKHIIVQTGMTFVPDNLLGVLTGDTVEWVWTGGLHTTTSAVIPEGAATWDEQLSSTHPIVNYVPTVSGEYNYVCTYHAAFGMIGKFTVSSQSAGINTPVAADNIFDITPNPVTDNNCILTLSSAQDRKITVKLYDLLGAEIKTAEISLSPGTNTQSLNLTGLKNGIYFVQVWNDNEKLQTKKLVKR